MKKIISHLVFALLLAAIFNTAKADIPHLDLSKNENIVLTKQVWKFYYGHTYKEVSQNSDLNGLDIFLPHSWGENGEPKTGYGTYVFKFTHDLSPNEFVTLHLLTIGCNYDLFINGILKNSVGSFSVIPANSIPNYNPSLISFELEKDTVEIAIQVSNYHYREGGIWFSPRIGKHNIIEASYFKTLFFDSFLIGSLLIMFIYFTAFYFVKRTQNSSLMFAMICLFAAIRIAATGDILFRQLGVPISWSFLVKLEYISLPMMLLFGYLYLVTFFSFDLNKKITKAIVLLQILIAIFFISVPISISSPIIPYFLIYCVSIFVYLLFISLKLIYQRRPLALWVGGAYAFLFVTAINDALYSQLIITSYYFLPFGVFVFALVQAISITRLFSNAFREVENLSAELVYTNKNQQMVILERTSMLNKQTEELLRSNHIKDKVFSIIAHDLRAPIKSLGTVLHWVNEDELSIEETKKSLAGISKNVDNLNLTLENLLNWSLSQLNGVKAEPELIDIRVPIQEITELYKVQIEEKNISFQSFIQSRIAVFIDKHHLNLLLRNIISNAIKFTPNKGTIEVAAINYEGNYTLVSVKDSGVGMNELSMKKVFSDTEHITTYGTNNEKGTGLGLLLCREYVENNHGKIWIESEENKGTIVFFTLPNYPM